MYLRPLEDAKLKILQTEGTNYKKWKVSNTKEGCAQILKTQKSLLLKMDIKIQLIANLSL
jgi:hypothetical protein